jgi:predicted phage gp36 major capsid-like protein
MEQWNSVKNPPETKVSHKESNEKSLDSNTKGLDSLAREGSRIKTSRESAVSHGRLKCFRRAFQFGKREHAGERTQKRL